MKCISALSQWVSGLRAAHSTTFTSKHCHFNIVILYRLNKQTNKQKTMATCFQFLCEAKLSSCFFSYVEYRYGSDSFLFCVCVFGRCVFILVYYTYLVTVFVSLHFFNSVVLKKKSPGFCSSPPVCLPSNKQCVFTLLCLLHTLTHSPCTGSPAHHGSVTALRSWWGDRKDFWLLCVAGVTLLTKVCVRVSCLTKRSVNTEGPCWIWPHSVSDSTLHLPVTSSSDLSQTQQTLRQTDTIWKLTFWILHCFSSCIKERVAKFKLNKRRVCKSSWTSLLFSLP